jgi:Ca-activated chloride channel family protein
MTGVLHNPSHMLPTAHASNGARLVSRTGAELPLRGITLTCEAVGGIAHTRLRQHFTNAYPTPLELTYSFPLPPDGAVAGYEVHAGNRVITGRIARRDEARAQYETARLEGRTASLVEQERANLFTLYLGNIPPSTDVAVTLTIDHALRWIPGGVWEWRFPTVVAPRYLGANGVVSDADLLTIDVVNGATSPTASVALTIADDLAVAPTSSTHALSLTGSTVTLAKNAVLDRDIVIRWPAPRKGPACTIHTVRAAASEPADDAAYGLLTIVPPVGGEETLARDLVLLLDVSGSMEGKPLEQLKAVVTGLIDSLNDDDRVEMVAFSSRQVRYREEPVAATSEERQRARAWIGGLQANGGTELISAIDAALRPLRADASRQVIVVTDGLIGFESKAVRAIRDSLPQRSRLHTVGVGSASNRAFLRPAARAGRGMEILIDLDDAAERGTDRILAATREPVVVDVTLHGSALLDSAPRLPDLLTGSPVLAALRLRPEGGTLVLCGNTAHGVWEERLDVPRTLPGEGREAIPALWAREAIEDLELDLACGGERIEIDRRIEQIALQYLISSRLTSWIAIAAEPGVDPRHPVRIERLPQALPYGMSAEGVGLGAVLSTASPSLVMRSALLPTQASRARDERRKFEMEREAGELRGRLGEIRNIARDGIERLQYLVEAIEKSTNLSLPELGMPSGELRARRRELLERLESLAHEASRWPRPFEPLITLVERLREMIDEFEREPVPEPVPLRGRVLPTPGRPTATVEMIGTSGLDWQPAPTAAIVGRTVKIVEHGTTRPGPIVAGSLIRVELDIAPELVVRASTIELECGADVLVITIAAVD